MSNSKHSEYDNFSFHPYNIMMILLLVAISALFLALSGALVYTRIQENLPPIQLPSLFIFNTLILLTSSWTMLKAKKAYEQDETNKYQQALLWTILISFLFLIAQYFGWQQLFARNEFFNSDNSVSYLYLLSGLHFAHVIAGLPFLVMFLRTARKQMKEPVSVLVYFSDPEKRLKLRLLTLYWHFLDGLWIYLVLFFWINYLIQ